MKFKLNIYIYKQYEIFFQVIFWLCFFMLEADRSTVSYDIDGDYCVNPQWSRATEANSKDLPWEDIKLLTQCRAHLRSVLGRNS